GDIVSAPIVQELRASNETGRAAEGHHDCVAATKHGPQTASGGATTATDHAALRKEHSNFHVGQGTWATTPRPANRTLCRPLTDPGRGRRSAIASTACFGWRCWPATSAHGCRQWARSGYWWTCPTPRPWWPWSRPPIPFRTSCWRCQAEP